MKSIKVLVLICVLFLSSCGYNQEKENINTENTNSGSVANQNIVPIEDKENPIIKMEDCNADNQVDNSGKRIISVRLPGGKGNPTRSEIEADSDTFEMLDGGYAKDKNNVYYRGSKIKGINIDSFKVFGKSSYSKDKNNIYYRSGKIENADLNTFEVLKGWYAKDKNYVYFDGEILEHNNIGYLYGDTSNSIDSKTFEVLSYCGISKEDYGNIINYEIINNYSKNKDGVYYKGKEIKGADPETFVISSIGYAKDKNAVYLDGGKFKDADPKTFQVIDRRLSKDKDNIYYIEWYYDDCTYCSGYGNKEYKVIPMDTDSFKFLNDKYFTDNKNVYYLGDIVENSDSSSFEILDKYYAKDKNSVYYLGDIIENSDPSSFEILNDEYSKDKNSVYYLGNIIENSDSNSFGILDEYYARDKDNIYFSQNSDKPFILEGIDLENFEVYDFGYAKDDKNIYYMGIKTNIVDVINNVKVFNTEYIENNNKIYFNVSLKDLENDGYYNFSEVDGVDINTFEALDYHYAKDKNSIYFAGSKISNNVDIDSFNVIDYNYTEDKNNCYKQSEIEDKTECEKAKCFYKNICPQKEELLKNEQIKNLLPEDANIIDVQKIDFENDGKDEYVIELKSNIAYMEENWGDTDGLFYGYYVLAMDENGKWNKVHEESYNWMTLSLRCGQTIISNKNFLVCSESVDGTGNYRESRLFTMENGKPLVFNLSDRDLFEKSVRPYFLEGEEMGRSDLGYSDIYSKNFFNSTCSFKGYIHGVNITYDLTYEDGELGVINVKRNNYYTGGCFGGYEVKGVDKETFKVLSKHYAQDKDNCYKNNKIVDKSECSENIVD